MMASPPCEVRRQHALCALNDLYEHAKEFLDRAAVKELLLALAKFNDEVHVAVLCEDLSDENSSVEPELLKKVVQSFLACPNLDAALRYLQEVLNSPGYLENPPQDLIIEVIKASTEAELTDDSSGDAMRPKAWEAFDMLEHIGLTSEAA